VFSDGSLPPAFPTIDNFTGGIANSIKSTDLSAATYQDAARLTSRVKKYVYDVEEFEGAEWDNRRVVSSEITGRSVTLVVPKGSMTEEQRIAIDAVRTWAKSLSRPVEIHIIKF
jgi:CDI toxin restriction endonuclease-like domain